MIRPRHFVILLLVLLLAGLASAPFSVVGTRALIGLANRVEIIDISYRNGSLAGKLELEHVRVHAGPVLVEVQEVTSDLDPACVWRSVICFEHLQAERVQVTVEASEESPPPAESSEMLRWPVHILADQLLIGEVLVHWPGGHWRQQAMSARVEMFDSVLRVESAEIQGAELVVESPADDGQGVEGDLALPGIDLPLELRILDLKLSDSRASIRGVEQDVSQLLLTGQWLRHRLAIEALRFVIPQGQASLQGSLDLQKNWPVQAVAEIEALELGEAEYSLQTRISGDFSAANLQLEANGAAQLQLEADVNLVTQGMPFTGAASFTVPEGQLLGELLELPQSLSGAQQAGPLQATFKGDLDRQQFELGGAFTGLGYERLAIQLRAEQSNRQVLIDTLELRDEVTDSGVIAQGKVALAEVLSIDGTVQSSGLSLPQLDSTLAGRLAGQGQFSVAVAETGWQLSLTGLDVSGEVNELPATLSGHASLDEGLHIGDTRLRGQLNGAELSVDAAQGDHADALVKLQLADLARWHRDARGRLQMTATRSPGGETFEITGGIQQLRWQGLIADSAELQGHAGVASESFSVGVQLFGLAYGGTEMDTLRLAAAGSLNQHSIGLFTTGGIAGGLEVAGSYEAGSWHGQLAPATFVTGSGNWSLHDAVALSWQADSGTLEVAEHCWQHSEFSACLGLLQLGPEGRVKLTASGELSAFNALLPSDLRLAGSVELALDSNWSPAAPFKLEAQGHSENVTVVRDFGLGDSTSVSWDSLTVSLAHDASGMNLQSELHRQGRRVMALDLQLPPEPDQELTGTVLLEQMELQSGAPWAPELSRLEGWLNGELRLAGTIDQPSVKGELRLSDGNLALEGNPTEVTELDLQVRLVGEGAELKGRGLLGGGELQLEGVLSSQPQWQLELNVIGADHQILVPPSAEVTISEELVLKIIPGLVDISGDIRVLEGVLHHEQLPAGSVAVSPDVVEVDLSGNLIREESNWKVRSDVWLHLRDRLLVQGESINTSVGGDLHLQQHPGQPMQLFGNLNILGGELRVYRQRLVIRRGTVAFSGPPGNPALDIRAEREIRDEGIKVGASLQGRLEEPTLEVYSTPPMPQGEAMSYLVRGRGLDSGAGADGTALALAMGADVVNRSGVVSSLNRIPGISDVAFGSSGNEDDTAATVSGYLGERIYLSYGIGLYEPINELTARLYMQSRLWLEVVSRLENSVDIYYSFDID